MATEQQVLDLIREAGDFVPADVLDDFGASTATLQSLVASGKVNLFKVADVDLANGIYSTDSASGASYIEVNDADWLKPISQLSCRVKIQLSDYTSGASRMLMAKDIGYLFSLTSSDEYNLTIHRASDSAAVSYTSTDPIALTNGSIYWLRADWTDPNDDGDAEVSFFVSSDLVADSEDVTTWTLIETLTDTSHGISYDSSNLNISNRNGSAGEAIEGVLYAAEFYGENQRQMQYSFEYSAQLPVFSNIVRDNYSNVLSIVGTSHRFINNTIGKIYYKFND
jgi:hypothetical protein